MSDISDVVDVTVDSNTAVITRIGYGTPLILSHVQGAGWTGPELVREYTKPADILADFAITTPEYIAGSILFSAKKRPPKVLIGRCASNRKVTQQFRIIPTAVDSTTYKMIAGSSAISFTAGISTTASLIIAGLKALIDALSPALGVTISETAVDGTAGTGAMKIVANVAGAFFNFGTVDPNLDLRQVHADPGVATDLSLINIERPDWYGLITLYNSKAYVTAAATWAQANSKLYGFQTQDSDVMHTTLSAATTADGSGTADIVTHLKLLAQDHVFPIMSRGTADFADAAWMGRCLPLTPGTETWKFKTLIGVSVASYNATERANMRAKHCNFYENTIGAPMTEEGITVTGAFIDFIRYIDSLKSGIAEDVFVPLVEQDKVDFDDNGMAQIENIVGGHLQRDETARILNAGWSTSVPKLADIAQADKDVRLFQGVEFKCVYKGGIHKVKVHGQVIQ